MASDVLHAAAGRNGPTTTTTTTTTAGDLVGGGGNDHPYGAAADVGEASIPRVAQQPPRDDDNNDDEAEAPAHPHQHQHQHHQQQHHPLAGVVLCCTAIPTETRSALAEAAAPLGAAHSLDLTAAVSHLLVGHWETAKYAFVARARPDVRVLQPSFVEAVREQWMAGVDAVDVPALERAHAYPPLQGALVCVTGLGDAAERRTIEARVHAAGGSYTGDLTRDVTHLIAARPEGAKYVHARQWKIHVTVLQWLWDSLERGMLLDAAYYDPLLPTDEIGRGAYLPASAIPHPPAKRKNSDGPAPARKLRRTASAKFSSQNSSIWGDIVGAGLTNLNPEKPDAWRDTGVADTGVADSFRSERRREPGPQRTVSESAIRSRPPNDGETVPRRAEGMFSGTNVFVHGFGGRETAVLERHLRTHAATLYDDAAAFAEVYTASRPSSDPLPFLVLVPHSLYPTVLPPPLDALDPPPPLATDFYVEAALHARRLPPSASPLHRPLPRALPGFSSLTLCVTGFADAELLHVAKAIARFGATYTGTLRREASALVCREPDGGAAQHIREMERRDKVTFARTHAIPVVRAGWLWECARQGRKVSWAGWEVGASSHTDKTTVADPTPQEAAAAPIEPFRSTHPPPHEVEAPSKALTDAKPPIAAVAVADTTPTSPLKPAALPMAGKETPLAAALSTLLAARSRSTSHSFVGDAAAGADDHGSIGARRRRTLLGRAPSGASLRSVGSANTDGVGTPVEGAGLGGDGANSSGLANPGGGSEGMDVDGDDDDDPPQLTQVGYQDVPAEAWRKQMAARMGTSATSPTGGGRESDESDIDDTRHSLRIRDEPPESRTSTRDDGRRVLRRRG